MASKESEASEVLLCLALVVLAASLCGCASLTGFEAPNPLTRNSRPDPKQTHRTSQHHGKLIIGQSQQAAVNRTRTTENLQDVQADMAWSGPSQHSGPMGGATHDTPTVERLLRLEPKVECSVDAMTLHLDSAASTALFFVDRGYRLPPLPLSKLPASCGYDIRSTLKDLVLVAPYDGCFVTHEADSYVLPLRWCGLPLRVSCPLMKQPPPPNPPMVTCHVEGMVVTTEWNVPADRIRVLLTGHWEPLLKASQKCRLSVIEHPEGVVISVHYEPCIEKKDGLYSLELSGDGEIKITCPSLLVAPTVARKNLSASVRKPYPTPPKPESLPIPTSPEKPSMESEKPSLERQDTDRTHLAYYIFHPRFLNTKPSALDTRPTEVSLNSLSTMTPNVQERQDQRGQMFYQLPFLPHPPQPPPTQPPMKRASSDDLDERVLPPVHSPKSVNAPATFPGNPEQVSHFLFYHHHHRALTEAPSSHPEYQDKSAPNPRATFPDTPSIRKESPELQPEASNSQVYKHAHPPHPQLNPGNPLTIDPTAFLAPLNHPPNGVHHHYHIHPKPVYPWQEEATSFPQRQVLQPFPPHTKPRIQQEETSEGVQQLTRPDSSTGRGRRPSHSSYRKPKLEPQPSDPAIENPRSYRKEAPKVQSHPPMHTYPTLGSDNPPEPNSPTHQGQKKCDSSELTNDQRNEQKNPKGGHTVDNQSQGSKTQSEQSYHPFYLLYHPQGSQQPQTPAPYFVLIINHQVPRPVSDATPPPGGDVVPQSLILNPLPLLPCSSFCPAGSPDCCAPFAFHQHLHQIFPVFSESKDAPAFHTNSLFLPPLEYSDVNKDVGVPPSPLNPSDGTWLSTPPAPPVPFLLLSVPSSDTAQDPLQALMPGLNRSTGDNLHMHLPHYYQQDFLHQPWTHLPQDDLYRSQPPTRSGVAENPMEYYETPHVPFLRPEHDQRQEDPELLFFLDQYLHEQQRNKPTATKQTFTKKTRDPKDFPQPESPRELEPFLVPYKMLQDSPNVVDRGSPSNKSIQTSISSESRNSSQHVQTLDFYSEEKSFSLKQHRPPDGVQESHQVVQNLDMNLRSESPNSKSSNHMFWLREGMSNPVPGNVQYMPTNGDQSTSKARSVASDRPRLVITPQSVQQPEANYPESLRGFWESLVSLGSGPGVPPHVPGKAIQRRSAITGR